MALLLALGLFVWLGAPPSAATPLPHGTMAGEAASPPFPAAERSAFDTQGAAGILELPVESGGQRHPAVVILHDVLGPDGRSDGYARQLLGAGLAVLELQRVEGEGLANALRQLALHHRIDAGRLGLLGFGDGARDAATAALPLLARALLYPGCATIEPPQALSGAVLLLHGQADPTNPMDACARLAAGLAAAGAAVTHRAYPEAGFAWDYPPTGTHGSILLPAGGMSARVRVRPWPALGALSAAQVAGFFSVSLAGGAP